jgi:hypothetical protein
VTLAGGANAHWDMSRRKARVVNINATPPLNPPSPLDVNTAFPSDPVVGNDDANQEYEINDPYATGGNISSQDHPERKLGLQGGHVGAVYEKNLDFQEFARLEIGGKWYVISESEAWELDFSFLKTQVLESEWGIDTNLDGDTLDVINESDAGVSGDTNGDGDATDVVSRWLNNGSKSTN